MNWSDINFYFEVTWKHVIKNIKDRMDGGNDGESKVEGIMMFSKLCMLMYKISL